MTTYTKPLPAITSANRRFWEACRNRELRLPRCTRCGAWVFPISPVCQSCWWEELEWDRLSGRGTISSWVVFQRAFDPAFAADVPYVVAQVDLEEGMRFVAGVAELEVSELSERLPVEAVFEDVTDEVSLVRFRPRR